MLSERVRLITTKPAVGFPVSIVLPLKQIDLPWQEAFRSQTIRSFTASLSD